MSFIRRVISFQINIILCMASPNVCGRNLFNSISLSWTFPSRNLNVSNMWNKGKYSNTPRVVSYLSGEGTYYLWAYETLCMWRRYTYTCSVYLYVCGVWVWLLVWVRGGYTAGWVNVCTGWVESTYGINVLGWFNLSSQLSL